MHRIFPAQDVDVSILAVDGRTHLTLPGRLRRGAGQVCHLVSYSSPEAVDGWRGLGKPWMKSEHFDEFRRWSSVFLRLRW